MYFNALIKIWLKSSLYAHCKIVLVMQLTTVLLFTACLQTSAISYAQKVTIIGKNVSLKKIFKDIRRQTGYSFIYAKEDMKRATPVTLNMKNADLLQVLNNCFAHEPLTYSIDEKLIVVKPRPSLPAVQTLPNKEIKGVVTDSATGKTLTGVTIRVKGTTTGTTTDTKGKFTLEVPDNAVLEFSYIGYNKKEIPVRGSTSIHVTLSALATGLNQLVVVGYGRQTAKDLTGSISSINTSTLTDLPDLRVDQMLQGKAAGMMVTQLNGAPGQVSSIRIRGNSSITASSEPLYVIDGLIGSSDLSTINPADIASISVLKDASATAIYGSQGANGVIIITTKKGNIGPPRININFQNGWQWLPREIKLLNGPQYAELLNETREAVGAKPVYDDPKAVQTTDWQKAVMQTAPMEEVNASVSGGTQGVRYYLSGNYYNQQGIIKRTGVERLQVRANVESNISSKIKVGITMNAGSIKTDNNTIPPASELTTPPSMPIYNPDGTYYYQLPDPQYNGRYNTPVASQNLITDESYKANFELNAYVEYSPLDWMTIKSTYGGQMISYGRQNHYTSSLLPGQTTNQQFGVASISYNDNTSYQNENTISFTKGFSNDHVIDGVVGITFQGGVGQNANAGAQDFIIDANTWNNLAAGNIITRNIGSGYENWSMVSYLARFTYKYKERYLVTLTGREDGSSRLGPGNKWATFPSIALGWIASKEDFIKNLNVFSFLKLRASYGKVGNQAVNIYQTLSVLSPVDAIVNGQKVNAWTPGAINGNNSTYGNPDLRWEVKDQLDIGLEANFLDNRLNFVFDYYNATTNHLLILTEIPSQTGYTQQMSNVGKVSNTGFEITINSININKSIFRWTSKLTLANNENEVLHLGPTNADIITHEFNQGLRPIGILRKGEPVGSFLAYVSDGIWKEAQGQNSIMPGAVAGSVRYKDINGDGILNQADEVISGNGSPKWYGGLDNDFSYKGFGLNFFLSFDQGAKIFNGSVPALRSLHSEENHYPETVNRWNPVTNPNSTVPGALNQNVELYPSDRWIFDASYIRLESVSLYYHIPLGEKTKRFLKSAIVNLTGSNLFCLSPYNKWGYDPVVNQKGGADFGYNNSLLGFDYGAYPRAAVISIGANITF
jgi:TonB-linked SusC/RagA family outer membrane protein